MERYEQYIGKTLNGKYTIKELLGIGGMAYVFKATVKGTGQTVSVKILNEESGRDEKAVTRFVNESKAVSMLSHPNIVKIYDVVIEEDVKYLVMEYVDGITLKEYIDYKKTIEWGESVYYVSQILKALGHAHSTGIIHRDVKPQNIMITREGVIKVMDFGIAKLLKSESITMTDMALGTVDYISPEQASGKKIGFYSDIYSVGVLLYEMITGTLPFIAESPMAVAMMQVQDDPVAPGELNADIPKGLEQIVLKAMNKEPDERFSSCQAMEKALHVISSDPTVVFSEHHKGGEKKPSKKDTKKRASFLAIISGVTAAFFIVLIGFMFWLVPKLLDGFNFETFNYNDNSKEITIPEYVGYIYSDELVSDKAQEGFDIALSDREIEHDPELPVGQIVSQSPTGGTKRKHDSSENFKITVTVNPPPEVFMLDDYTNANSQEIINILKRNGLTPSVKNEKHDTVIKGYIIRTEPEPGTILEKGESVVLYVSDGAALVTVTVPTVEGMSQDEAKRTLQENRISIGAIEYEESDLPEGTVISQSIPGGEKGYEYLTEVSLVVSKGRDVIIPVVPEIDTDTEEIDGPDASEDTDSEDEADESEKSSDETGDESGEVTETPEGSEETDHDEEEITFPDDTDAESDTDEENESGEDISDDGVSEV